MSSSVSTDFHFMLSVINQSKAFYFIMYNHQEKFLSNHIWDYVWEVLILSSYADPRFEDETDSGRELLNLLPWRAHPKMVCWTIFKLSRDSLGWLKMKYKWLNWQPRNGFYVCFGEWLALVCLPLQIIMITVIIAPFKVKSTLTIKSSLAFIKLQKTTSHKLGNTSISSCAVKEMGFPQN